MDFSIRNVVPVLTSSRLSSHVSKIQMAKMDVPTGNVGNPRGVDFAFSPGINSHGRISELMCSAEEQPEYTRDVLSKLAMA